MVEFIIPKSIFNESEFKRLAAANTAAVALAVKRDYEATVRTWERKPTFTIEYGKDEVIVSTGDDNYTGIDEGVPAHIIAARRSPVMRFQKDYKAKSQPGVIGSRSGGKSGNIIVANVVSHPGIQARKFTDAIKKKNDPKFFAGGNEAVAKANR